MPDAPGDLGRFPPGARNRQPRGDASEAGREMEHGQSQAKLRCYHYTSNLLISKECATERRQRSRGRKRPFPLLVKSSFAEVPIRDFG